MVTSVAVRVKRERTAAPATEGRRFRLEEATAHSIDAYWFKPGNMLHGTAGFVERLTMAIHGVAGYAAGCCCHMCFEAKRARERNTAQAEQQRWTHDRPPHEQRKQDRDEAVAQALQQHQRRKHPETLTRAQNRHQHELHREQQQRERQRREAITNPDHP